MNIYYHFPLQFHYNSGQTIQVIQDYSSLAKLGYRIFLFGTYEDASALRDIQSDIGQLPVHLMLRQGHSKWNRNWLKWRFLWKMLCDRSPKLIVSRNYNKTKELTSLRRFLGQAWIMMERHEDALPYLLKHPEKAPRERLRFAKLLGQIDALLLTSPAQLPFFRQEFTRLPSTVILPNGVDVSCFCRARPPNKTRQPPPVKHVTYVGQLTSWKNVELLFQSVALLDESFHLRIAGGKGDAASRHWVDTMTHRYGLQGRVDYREFVPRHRLVDEVLDGSSALLLPLGDNLESRHFTSPMKLFEYMATEIPVVAVDYPTVHLVTGDASVYLAPNDPHAFAQAIRYAVDAPDRTERIAVMQQLAGRYSHEQRAKQFHAYIQQMIDLSTGARL